MTPIIAACPVCRRNVHVRKSVFRHLDTAGTDCPMSGKRIPPSTLTRGAA